MRIADVIGTVTLSRVHPSLAGARWVIGVPYSLKALRAVGVATVAQAAQALLTLGPNLVAVEMPGRTFFEIRQILRSVCLAGAAACPDGVACTLRELDGHAHR